VVEIDWAQTVLLRAVTTSTWVAFAGYAVDAEASKHVLPGFQASSAVFFRV